MVSPNSREGTVGIYIHYILYSLVLILYLKCGGGLGGGGGGGCNVFLTFYAIFYIFRKKYLGIQNNYFSFNGGGGGGVDFFFLDKNNSF